jgi:glycosyltransferase involved in cell wall biosynthesis
MSKIRILLIGPWHHGMGQQISVLQKSLKEHHRVAYCDWVGSKKHYFTPDLIWKKAKKIIKDINFSLYDIVNVHYGKLEIEQVIPFLLKDRKINLPPFVYSVHSLKGDLFKILKRQSDPLLQEKINRTTRSFFDGYIYYGTYAAKKYSKPGKIIFIHEQHSHVKISEKESKFYQKIFYLPSNKIPFIAILGYASPWKDWETLLQSFYQIKKPLRVLFAGPGWKKKLYFRKKLINNITIYIVNKHLNEKEFFFLINSSTFGCFPYQTHESFQGSGILPNFLYQGKACIVTKCANLPEMLGKAGIVVPQHNSVKLAKAINDILEPKNLSNFEKEAKLRSFLFSREYHAEQCVNYFTQIISMRKNKDSFKKF